jgi:hypothetical protein
MREPAPSPSANPARLPMQSLGFYVFLYGSIAILWGLVALFGQI